MSLDERASRCSRSSRWAKARHRRAPPERSGVRGPRERRRWGVWRGEAPQFRMSSYRFCRTDDIGLLVDALNRCWLPHFPDEPPMTPAAFKRSIRDLQVWCSSCMVAFSGSDPIGVLIGAKRPSGTLIHKIAVHPDHLAAGSRAPSARLARLEARDSRSAANRGRSPRGVRARASRLFSAGGYVQEAVLTDYVWQGENASVEAVAPREWQFHDSRHGRRPCRQWAP